MTIIWLWLVLVIEKRKVDVMLSTCVEALSQQLAWLLSRWKRWDGLSWCNCDVWRTDIVHLWAQNGITLPGMAWQVWGDDIMRIWCGDVWWRLAYNLFKQIFNWLIWSNYWRGFLKIVIIAHAVSVIIKHIYMYLLVAYAYIILWFETVFFLLVWFRTKCVLCCRERCYIGAKSSDKSPDYLGKIHNLSSQCLQQQGTQCSSKNYAYPIFSPFTIVPKISQTLWWQLSDAQWPVITDTRVEEMGNWDTVDTQL